MADPVEPVDLGADPAPAHPSDPAALLEAQQDTDDILNDLAERIDTIENDRADDLWVACRRNRLWTMMAAGALVALGLFLLVERLRQRAAP